MKTIQLLISLSIVVYLTSCENDHNDPFPQPQGDGLIKFEMGFADDDSPKTRVNTLHNFTSLWENGDKIGLYIVKGGGSLQPSGNYADNVEFTHNGGAWTASTPLHYPNDGDNLSFYAYYPYNASMSNPNAYTFNVPTDQRSNDGEHYKKNDFLWAKLDNVPKSDNAVALQFSHALAMIEIAISKNEPSIPLGNLLGAVTECTINLANQSITPGSTKNTIQMWRRHGTSVPGISVHYLWALVPPQIMDIHCVWTNVNGSHYTVTPATNVTLTSGNVKRHTTTQP